MVILISAQYCTIFSLNPLYHEEDLIEETELLGFWKVSLLLFLLELQCP